MAPAIRLLDAAESARVVRGPCRCLFTKIVYGLAVEQPANDGFMAVHGGAAIAPVDQLPVAANGMWHFTQTANRRTHKSGKRRALTCAGFTSDAVGEGDDTPSIRQVRNF